MIKTVEFGEKKVNVPVTQGIKYAGSKLKMLPSIFEIIHGLEIDRVLDGFSGSTRVSQAFAQKGFQTISNDISIWSETFSKAFLLNQKAPKSYQELINHLNSIKGYEGWFSEYYGGTIKNHDKRPFQLKNTKKLDAIRDEIDRLNLNEVEKAVVLTSLILALDSVDNTLGHYAAYLADWSPRSYNNILLKVPKLFTNNKKNVVLRGDVFKAIENQTFDLAYFDPPYGSNNEKMPPSRVRYNSYYHIWTSIILNDKPLVFGKANRREDSRDGISSSIFEEYRKDDNGQFIAMKAIRKLISETNSRYILLSYSSGGRATKNELLNILNSEGNLLKVMELDYKKNVMSQMRSTNDWINSDGRYLEYLFLLRKD